MQYIQEDIFISWMEPLQQMWEFGAGGRGVCYNSELPTFKGIGVGSQYLGTGSILFALQGPVEAVGD